MPTLAPSRLPAPTGESSQAVPELPAAHTHVKKEEMDDAPPAADTCHLALSVDEPSSTQPACDPQRQDDTCILFGKRLSEMDPEDFVRRGKRSLIKGHLDLMTTRNVSEPNETSAPSTHDPSIIRAFLETRQPIASPAECLARSRQLFTDFLHPRYRAAKDLPEVEQLCAKLEALEQFQAQLATLFAFPALTTSSSQQLGD